MTRVFEVDPRRPDQSLIALEAATGALAEGRLVVLPTETVYGIACRPDDPSATARVFAAKRRPVGLNLPVLVPSTEMGWEVAVPDERAARLARAFWPGPLTMVLPRTGRSREWELGRERDSVAVRVPDLGLALALLAMAGPLATTSANFSGRPPISDPDGLATTFGNSVEVLLVVASSIDPPRERPSTVVDLTGDTMRILREGSVGSDRVQAVIGTS